MANSPEAAPDRHRLGIIALLGLASGLPLLLTRSTLVAWMRIDEIGLAMIGLFTLLHVPYTFKFLWAPLLDRFRLPFLGRRRGWILLWQLALVASIAGLGMTSPKANIEAVFAMGMIVAFFGASLDVVNDAYRTEVLEEHERGPGAALFVTGYRAGMVVAGAFVLVLVDFISWRDSFFMVAGVMLLTTIVTMKAKPSPEIPGSPETLRDAAIPPLKDLMTRSYAAPLFVFILLYKLGEFLAGQFTNAFLIDMDFSTSAIGLINKGIGLPASIAGTLLGGVAVSRLGLWRSLMYFGVLQAVPNLLYAVLYGVGKNHILFTVIVSVDQFCNGLSIAAVVVLFMALCDKRYTAFQYAMLSAVSSLLPLVGGFFAGVLAENVGWHWFFVGTTLAALPALVILAFLPKHLGIDSMKSVMIPEQEEATT